MTVTAVLYDGDGVETDFTFPFDVSGGFGTALVVQIIPDGETAFVTQTEGEVSDGGDYILPTSPTATVRFHVAPPDGEDNVKLSRFTDRDRRVDYTGGSTLTEQNLDNDADRLTNVTQEIEAGVTDALQKNDQLTAWDGEGLPAENCAPATADDGWCTLGQATAIAQGGDATAQLDGADLLPFTGDGVTVDFQLQNYRTILPERCIVTLGGQIQHANAVEDKYEIIDPDHSDFPGGSWAYLRFTEAPANNVNIECRIFKGTVVAVFGEGTITSESLPDGVLEARHFDFPAVPPDTSTRRIVFDAGGTLAFQAEDSVVPFTGALRTFLQSYKLSGSGDGIGTPTANLSMGGHRITGLANGSASADAVTRSQLDAVTGVFDAKSNGSPGQIAFGSDNKITVDCGFNPDVIIITGLARIATDDIFATWIKVGRATGGPVSAGSWLPSGTATMPGLRIDYISSGFTAWISHENDVDAGEPIRSTRYLAFRYG